MTRIFDALRKARSAGAAAMPHPVPLPAGPARRGPAIDPLPSATAQIEPLRPVSGPVLGFPLAVPGELEEDVIQQMTGLRISIEAALPDRSRRVVMIQSSQRREGATTIALQFARALARDGRQRVVLLDAHALHPALTLDPEHRVAVPRGPAGRARKVAPARAAATLSSWPVAEDVHRSGAFPVGVLRELIETVGAGCNWVVVDGPPVLISAEACALAAAADGVILVVQSGRTKRPVLARSVELLSKAGARVFGTVLNRRRLEIPEFIYRRI
jgi:Mrp family chromosome partitioning ATPase